MIGAALAALLARPKLLILIAGALAASMVAGAIYLAGRDDGADSVRDEIRTEIDRSRYAGQGAFLDAEACVYSGREWDQERGTCR